jgi:transcription antitermination factor NusG
MSQLITMDCEPSSLAENHTYGETLWYVGYTASRHEKRVAEHLAQRNVEHYLPLYEAVHRWKDRNARVQLPLFPSYVFVHLALKDRMRTLTIPGIVGLVGHPKPTPLPGDEIEAIRNHQGRAVSRTPGLRIAAKVGMPGGDQPRLDPSVIRCGRRRVRLGARLPPGSTH